MTQLGFTFYPKDWWTSDSFYTLNPFERYVYLELLFMMYDNEGSIKNDRVNVERRLNTTIKHEVWSRITDLMIEDGDQLTHKSVNKRLRKSVSNRENGKKGGAPKGNDNAKKKQPKNNLKTTKNNRCFENENLGFFITSCESDEKQPKQPKKTTQNNPPFKREIEREKKIKEINTPTPPNGGCDDKVVEGKKSKEKKADKKPDNLNAKARALFEEYFRSIFSVDYYWTAKDSGNMKQILQKLEFQRKKKNMELSDESTLHALEYLLNSITEGWIFENFSVANINSKFNEIVSRAITTHGKSGKVNSTNRDGRSINPATDYATAANAPATFEDACRILDMLDGR